MVRNKRVTGNWLVSILLSKQKTQKNKKYNRLAIQNT